MTAKSRRKNLEKRLRREEHKHHEDLVTPYSDTSTDENKQENQD